MRASGLAHISSSEEVRDDGPPLGGLEEDGEQQPATEDVEPAETAVLLHPSFFVRQPRYVNLLPGTGRFTGKL